MTGNPSWSTGLASDDQGYLLRTAHATPPGQRVPDLAFVQALTGPSHPIAAQILVHRPVQTIVLAPAKVRSWVCTPGRALTTWWWAVLGSDVQAKLAIWTMVTTRCCAPFPP